MTQSNDPGHEPVARERARLEMPELLRRDVRLLGELLGQVLREYGGDKLLADVEELGTRSSPRAPALATQKMWLSWCAAGRSTGPRKSRARSPCTSTWPTWPKKHHRVRILRSRESGAGRPGDSLATRSPRSVACTARSGSARCCRGCRSIRSYRAPDRGPPARGRRAISRAGAQLDRVDDPRAGGAEQADARRHLLEEIDILWRTAHLRASAVDPLDEVRTAMAVFDETLFCVVPTLYRGLDHVLLGDRSGSRSAAGAAFLRLGSWIGGDRDGNPNVTADSPSEALATQAAHVLLALERAATRIGRTLTAEEATTPPSARADRARSRSPRGPRTRSSSTS